ncbi:MAG: glycosyltransferase family 61 protein [Pseudomonadota bacterium]
MSLLSRFSLLSAPVLQRLIGPGTAEVEVLQPAETVAVRPPAYLPDMLDRVTGTDEHSTIAYHIQVAQEVTVTHVPVLRKLWRNALVRRRGFATLRRHERYGQGFGLADVAATMRQEAILRYCHSGVSWRYFGHWLTDSIPTALIEPETGALWMPHDPSWSHAPGYLDALSLPALPDHPVLAKELVTYQDFGQGSHKVARYNRIRDQLQARFGSPGETAVYLRRGRTGAPRCIANEDALVEALLARNWQVIDIAGTSVETLQRALCPARIVVSIDGSHLDHAHLSLRPKSRMVVLVPQDRFTLRQVGLSRAHEVAPGFVVLRGSVEAGYHAELDEILRTLDFADSGA